ncbi:lantibiotic dehydratase family protein [Nocardiopsis sp. NRRL B-16309]|uniref:lantibiotic dehydratase family protein n=1 Tax=Nocardiopsis sp. NRRL B-16309 TaxID=1519494 RepID=UPI0006B065A7|nr:lantibiotic dehydratase family protein [Nocardiopsis sp. NRRL B-16309]
MFTQTARWQVVGTPYVRATVHADYTPPGWPDLVNGDRDAWCEWLRSVWGHGELAAAISHASPTLSNRVDVLLCGGLVRRTRARRVVAAVMRYVLRAQHRATPFGTFAGVTTAQFGEHVSVRWHGYRRIVAPTGAWVAGVAQQLQALPALLSRTQVIANSTASLQDGQLVVPQVARPDPGHPLATSKQARLRYTSAVQVAMESARHPTSWGSVVEAVSTAHPDEACEGITTMLTQLVWVGALLTNLRPPSTASPVERLEATLRGIGPGGTLVAKKANRIQEAIGTANAAGNGTGAAMEAMRELSSLPSLGVDLRLDADITLPRTVAHAAQDAMGMLEMLCPHRDGLASWRGWRERFIDRYGTGSLVPVAKVVEPSGVGYPDWDDKANASSAVSARDRWLLEQAQAAALDHRHEVLVDDLVTMMRGEEHARTVRHTEMRVRLESPSPAALDSGRFRLAVLGVSRTAATVAGRFASMTDTVGQLGTILRSLPGPLPVQLSFPPQTARSAHVARVPQLLDHVVSVAEYPSPGALGVDDLAVGCDGGGLFLWSHSLGCRVQPVVPHALNLRFAPALVRFLAELPRAERMPATNFTWGGASRLPFVPRLRSGRIVFSPACWRVRPEDLPPPQARWQEWDQVWSAFATRRRVPTVVELGGGDQWLRLDLAEDDHRYLLRNHLTSTGAAVLQEAPDPRSSGWCGGRPHELLFQLTRPQGEV